MKYAIILITMLLSFLPGGYAQKSVLLDAMKDEMTRAVDQLKMDGEARPYYISYLVQDLLNVSVAAESGSIVSSSENHSKMLRSDIRVGDYSQDNSNFMGASSFINSLPLDNDYFGFRRILWTTTDRGYKAAVETLTKKKVYLQNTIQKEELPDFTKVGATIRLATENKLVVDKDRYNQRVDQIAKMMAGQQGIEKSRVSLVVQIINYYYVNSEGAIVIEPYTSANLQLYITTRAEDGMPVSNYRTYTARPEELPDKTKIESDIKKMVSELAEAKAAPVADPYSGPVLFVGQAVGELINQGVGVFLTARRIPASPNTSQRNRENPLLEKINAKVASNFISVKAAPTLRHYGGQTLLGACEVDDEGAPCRDVSLIENGMLKNLLTSRTPVKGFNQSNGHGRGGSIAPSVLQIVSTNKKPFPELKQELLNAAKEEGLPFGYIIYGVAPIGSIGNTSEILASRMSASGSSEPNQFGLTSPYSIYRVYIDGKTEPVRGIDFGSININVLKNILATSEDEIVYDFNVGSGHYATVITPSLLIGGIDMKKSPRIGTFSKLPIVSPPNGK